MDSMVLQVQYHINIKNIKLLRLFLAAAILFSCSTQQNSPVVLKAYNADSIRLKENNGLVYNGASLFTGKLFKLSSAGDTLFVQDLIDGLKDGYTKFYYENKLPAEIRLFSKGKKQGTAEGWWPNREKKFEYHYNDDLFEGLQREWFENGQLYSSKNFLNGYENGMQQTWDSSGGILSNYQAINGRNYGNIGEKHCKSIFAKDSFIVKH